MKSFFKFLILALLVLLPQNIQASVKKLGGIEIVVSEPIVFENVNLWVIADHQGPIINRSCNMRNDCLSFVELKSYIEHIRESGFPEALAFELAKYCHFYHERDIPLTIVDSWQWKCDNVLCQFDSAGYDLAARGGSWQTCMEAVKTITSASSRIETIKILENEDFVRKEGAGQRRSDIEVRTFSQMRTRDGYPQETKF